MDQVVEYDRQARAVKIFAAVVNVQRRQRRCARVVTRWQVDINRSPVGQSLALELELLDVAVRDALDSGGS